MAKLFFLDSRTNGPDSRDVSDYATLDYHAVGNVFLLQDGTFEGWYPVSDVLSIGFMPAEGEK